MCYFGRSSAPKPPRSRVEIFVLPASERADHDRRSTSHHPKPTSVARGGRMGHGHHSGNHASASVMVQPSRTGHSSSRANPSRTRNSHTGHRRNNNDFDRETMTTEEQQKSSKPKQRTKKYFVQAHHESYWHFLRIRSRQKKSEKKEGHKSNSQPVIQQQDSQNHMHGAAPPNPSFHSNGGGSGESAAQFQQQQPAALEPPPHNEFPASRNQSQARSPRPRPRPSQPLPSQRHLQQQAHHSHPVTRVPYVHSTELNAHVQRGGQTEHGERPRGHEQSVYVDEPRGRTRSSGRKRSARGEGRNEHPWYPRTEQFEMEKTRRR